MPGRNADCSGGVKGVEQPWEVLIAGGGLVGLALALALDAAGRGRWRIAVVEAAALPEGDGQPIYRAGFDARSTALSRGSELVLRDLGLWQTLAPHAAPIRHIHVSQRGAAGSTELHAEAHGWEALGHVVENAWLGAVLLAAVRQRPAIALYPGRRLQRAQLQSDCALVEGEGGASFRARLLCIADGARSPLAASLGMGCSHHDYRCSALVTNVVTDRPHRQWAYERFADSGPMALLPLPTQQGRHRSALIWSLSPERAEVLAEAGEGEFLQAAQQLLGYRPGRLVHCGRRQLHPLGRSLAREQVRRRVAVMGNAAHALHPVAGQGFNLSLRDVAALARELAGQEDVGELAPLLRYSEGRRADQARTIGLSHHLPGLFELQQPGAGALRGLGLMAMDLLPGLRRGFGAVAAGCGPGMVQGVRECENNSWM